MALNHFYFTLLCDSEFVAAGRSLTAIGRLLNEHFISMEYGGGVKKVAVGVVMRELGRPSKRRKKPKYTREPQTSLLGHVSEDVLEFYVYPSLTSVRSANSVRDLIQILRAALKDEADAIRAVTIIDFDTSRFLSDLDAQLESAENSPGLWGRIAAAGFPPSAGAATLAVPSISPSSPNIDIEEFPSQVLVFVEHELPIMRRAAERKDRAALGPFLERLNRFIGPWADVMTSQGGIFETFPDCGHVLPDLGRELAIECDQSLADAERERLHLEFQRRFEACRACAERIQRDRAKLD